MGNENSEIISINNGSQEITVIKKEDLLQKEIGSTLLSKDLHVQKEAIKRDIGNANIEKQVVEQKINSFSAWYNDIFSGEIAKVKVLASEHMTLLELLKAKEGDSEVQGFIGAMGSMFGAQQEYENYDNINHKELNDDEQEEIKEMYKFLVKQLHPAAHETATEGERHAYAELFKLTQKAFDDGDIATIRILAKGYNRDLLKNAIKDTPPEGAQAEEETISLHEEVDMLRRFYRDIVKDIENLKKSDGYVNHSLIEGENEIWVNNEKERFETDITQYNDQIAQFKKLLDKDS